MIYEYRCTQCKVIIDVSQPYTEVGDFPCQCGGINKRYFSIKGIPNMKDVLTDTILDTASGRHIPVSEIDKYGKATGQVYMSDKEAKTEASIQLNYRKKDQEKKVKDGIQKKVREVLSR